MVAYYFSFKTALVKGSPNVVAQNSTVLIYDAADTARTTPVNAYSDPGLTTIINLVSDAYGIVPDFYTDNRPDILRKSGTNKGQWATSQPRPGLRGPSGPQGPQGVQGPQGNPGLNGAGTNADVAAYIPATGPTRDALDARFIKAGDKVPEDNIPTRLSATELDARFLKSADVVPDANLPTRLSPASQAAAIDAAVPDPDNPIGNKLRKIGYVIDRSNAGSSWDNILVESLTVIQDPESGRLAGVFTGYGDVTGVQQGSIGLAYSDDGIRWEKQGKILGGTGVAGDPDRYGTTGPVIVYDGGLYYLFYIGLGATGYEGAPRTLMLATTPSLKNPVWTRRGKVLGSGGTGWRSQDVWHPSIIRKGDTWYCFINATGADGKESIGYATASALLGPWTFDDTNSPLVSPTAADSIIGDPSVTKMPGGWRMDYFAAGGPGAEDWYTTTTDAKFPLGWKAHDRTQTQRQTVTLGPAGSYDESAAHKPFIFQYGGRTFHYYTSVMAGNANRRVALAIDGHLSMVGETTLTATAVNVGTFTQVRTATGETSATKTASSPYATIMAAKGRVQARAGDLLELTVAFIANADPGDLRVDACTYNGSTVVNYVSGLGAGGHGVTAWGTVGGRYTHRSGTYWYTVQAVDVINGTVTLAPVFKAEANGQRGILNIPQDPTVFTVRNLG